MSLDLNLNERRGQAGYGVYFSVKNNWQKEEPVLSLDAPVMLETWDAVSQSEKLFANEYSKLSKTGQEFVGECVLGEKDSAHYKVVDRWKQVAPDTWQVDRSLKVEEGLKGAGVRLRLDFNTAFVEGVDYVDLRYFAPPILYDHNDLDDDGVEDYLETQNLLYREDRLNMLAVMAYYEKRRVSLTLIRATTPNFDSQPVRPNKERRFLQKTDIGSLGFWKLSGKASQVCIRACYPFYEGERSHALTSKERLGWEAYWPAQTGETMTVSYQIRAEDAESFHSALWNTFRRRLRDLDPKPTPLPAAPDEITTFRMNALDRYYLEADTGEYKARPAGFVLNCHPQDGKQLSSIIQYGFTGQNILNAYCYLRYGHQSGDQQYIRKARNVIDFYVKEVHIPRTGMFYNGYNVDENRMDFWWYGLLLPLAYAKPGESLERLMGPLYERLKPIITELQSRQGSYLRSMSEGAFSLLRSYEFERAQGTVHNDWLDTVQRYCEFLLRSQEADGSWYRAYDLQGNPLTVPEQWFGTGKCEQKSSTSLPIPLLVRMHELTHDSRYIEAARKAGRFVRETLVDPVKFNGGLLDSMYSIGLLIDYCGIGFAMIALLALYRTIGGEYFREGTINAARLYASWTCLWDVPLPAGSTLARYDFRSAGIGACDTCGAGFVHCANARVVPELLEIARAADDRELFDVAVLTYHGCSQTVAVPDKDWGLKHVGLQEEAYLISALLIDDPIFEGTKFGHRLKGEGNKSCFAWIPAAAMDVYWKMRDRYGTFDFESIRCELFGRPATGTGGSTRAG